MTVFRNFKSKYQHNFQRTLKAPCTFDAFDFWSPLDLMELNPYIVLGLLDLELKVSL